ncbi:MAG: hypothetical protein M0024_10545 [Nitrospiraceae bacterium]|nr:hypothetical protein [Nitrospiraceae bacterium]
MAKKKEEEIIKREYDRIIKHKPKEKADVKMKHISFDYPREKYIIVGDAIYDGMYPSVASILRDALDTVVAEYQRSKDANKQ